LEIAYIFASYDLAVAYILCAIFDMLFPPYGFLAKLSSASPWPIYGGPISFLTGFVMLTTAGFVFGAFYRVEWEFWSTQHDSMNADQLMDIV
jgi:hypothetical protein